MLPSVCHIPERPKMTISFNDFNASTVNTGESLLHELTRSLRTTQATQAQTKARYGQWRAMANPAPTETATGMIFETMLMSLLMQTLFGMPMLSGFGVSDDAIHGLGALGSGMHHEQSDRQSHSIEKAALINQALVDAQRARMTQLSHTQSAKTQQLTAMKRAIATLLISLMNAEEDTGSSEGDEGLVPDVLRHPKLARFKQNRHSISCVRTMFKNQANAVVPQFPTLKAA